MFPGGECALQLQAQVGPMPAQLPMMHLKASCALRASAGLRAPLDIDSSSRACHLKPTLPGEGSRLGVTGSRVSVFVLRTQFSLGEAFGRSPWVLSDLPVSMGP